jgi:Ca2+-dependent lipid-binding protein
MRTHIVKMNAHPIYNELFHFVDVQSSTNDTFSLVMTVFTYDRFTRDEIIGELVFPFQLSMLNTIEMTFTFDITPRYQQVRFKLIIVLYRSKNIIVVNS